MSDKSMPFITKSKPIGLESGVPFRYLNSDRALKNHGQTLSKLADRGGLDWGEMLALILNKHWSECMWKPEKIDNFYRSFANKNNLTKE